MPVTAGRMFTNLHPESSIRGWDITRKFLQFEKILVPMNKTHEYYTALTAMIWKISAISHGSCNKLDAT